MLSFSFLNEKMCDANFLKKIMYLLRKGFRKNVCSITIEQNERNFTPKNAEIICM